MTSFCTFRGKKLINLRVYYQAEDDWRPSPGGLTLAREKVIDLKEAIDKAALEFQRELPGSEEPEKTEEAPIPFCGRREHDKR